MIKDMLKLRAMCGGGSGSGLPEGGAPYQQLVTDGEGKTVWEDRLAYSNTTTPLNIPTIDPNVGFEGQQFADVWTVKQTNMSSFEMTAYIGDVMADESALRGPEDLVGSTLQFYKNGNIEEVRIEKDHLIDDGVKFKDGLMLFEIDANSTVKFGVEIEMYGERRPTIFLVDVYRNDIKPIDPKYLPEGVGTIVIDVTTTMPDETITFDENAKAKCDAVLQMAYTGVFPNAVAHVESAIPDGTVFMHQYMPVSNVTAEVNEDGIVVGAFFCGGFTNAHGFFTYEFLKSYTSGEWSVSQISGDA